jgi:predicted dehydrogenase
MEHTVAFVGFRHGHVWDVFDRMRSNASFRIVACCEEDPETRKNLAREGKVQISHTDFAEMLRSVQFDVCVVGDYYEKRGALILAALKSGRSVISDKPLCTSMRELDRIASAVGRSGQPLGAMLDLRDSGIFRRMRGLIRDGDIGEVATLSFNGDHPLLLGKRPGWYFEKGKQGGTINDLGIHAFDGIPWLTGHRFTRINAARTWATGRAGSPYFKDAAQVMATLDNGCGVLGEISYLVPDRIAYGYPDYWRFVVAGSKGVVIGRLNDGSLTLFREGAPGPESIPAAAPNPGGYLQSYLRALEHSPAAEDLGTADVLDASRVSLLCQEAADNSTGYRGRARGGVAV